MVHEQINSTEDVYVVRRPVFQLDMDMSCLRDLVFPAVMIPGEKGSSSTFALCSLGERGIASKVGGQLELPPDQTCLSGVLP